MSLPGIERPTTSPSIRFLLAMWETVEVIVGTRIGKTGVPPLLTSEDVSGTPTAAQYNALRADVVALRATVDDLIARIERGE